MDGNVSDKEGFKNADEAYKAGFHWCPVRPCEPTPFSPGTVEKLRVLRERYWAGQELYHPDDGDILGFVGTQLPTSEIPRNAY